MPNRFKKLVVTFLTIFIAGSVFLPSISFAQPGPGSTATTTQQNPTNQVLTQTGSGYVQSLPSLPICSVIGEGEGTFEGCFVRLFYYAILYPSAWIASIAGQVFDYFVAYTLNSESYHSGGFVESGWRIVRDLINASFIFILLYVAIRFIINAQSSGMSRIVPRIIILAIIINFSLFMTRAIIDVGNILGRVFYEKIVVENDTNGQQTGYTTLSAGLIGKVNPQKLLSPDTFRIRHQATGIDSSIQQNTLGTLDSVDSEDLGSGFKVGAGFMILIILLAAAVNIMLAWVFFSVSLSLVGRTLGLWIMMIMSPVAFASASIPFIKIPTYGFSDWLKKTLQLSFMAVLFMFFLYLTIMFLDVANSTILNVAFESQNMSTVHLIMAVIVPCMAVVYLLFIAKNQAKSMSGEFGDIVGKALKWGTVAALGAGGLALGATAGVAAAGLRQTAGRAGAKIAASADTSTATGRIQKRFGNYMANSKYDARNINIPKPAKSIIGAGKSGLSYATGGALSANDFNLKALNTFGKPSDKSYVQRREDYAKEKIDRAKMYKMDEGATVNDIQGTYTYEELQDVINPKTGKLEKKVVKKTGTVSGSTSVNGAKSEKAKAQRELEAKKAEIHQNEKYDEKKRELEDREKNAENAEKAYKEMLDKKKAGDPSVTQKDVDIAEMERNSKKNLVNVQKKVIKDIENMYIAESNKVAEAEARIAAAERALAAKNAKILNNYADSVESWAAFPDAGLTHRYGGNKDASGEIRDLANKEEKKGSK